MTIIRHTNMSTTEEEKEIDIYDTRRKGSPMTFNFIQTPDHRIPGREGGGGD